jgi:hypothetical protein
MTRRTSDGRRIFQLTPSARSRKFIESISSRVITPEKEWEIEVEPGSKFNFDEFTSSVFSLPSRAHRVKIETQTFLMYESGKS